MNNKDYIIPSNLPDIIPEGDMPGDKILITDLHLLKTKRIFPLLIEDLNNKELLEEGKRWVVSIFGGSGTGKSEIAAILAYYFSQNGKSSYILSGDNYAIRTLYENNYERINLFREAGVKALIKEGLYNFQVKEVLDDLWLDYKDFDEKLGKSYSFWPMYFKAGCKVLADYLGSKAEMDFDHVSGVIKDFKAGKSNSMLKRKGEKAFDVWYEGVDFTNTDILFIEWVLGNSKHITGIDSSVLLDSIPEETIEHRRSRARDSFIDDPYVMTVLHYEGKRVEESVNEDTIIINNQGEIINYSDYQELLKKRP